MRAIVLRSHGGPDVLSVEEVPVPAPGAGEVRIRAHRIAVNYPDLLVLRGRYQVRPPLPFTPGKELAGVVAAVGPGVAGPRAGDRVWASLEHGAYAEEVVVRAADCLPIPGEMTFATAAALGNPFQTAWFALVDRARLAPGESVLVTVASGAVGQAAVQLAKAMGATVLAGVRSAGQAERARANGADRVVDVAAPGLRDALREQVRAATGGRGADVVLDPVGGDVFDAALRALAWCGRLVVIGFASGRIPEVKASYLLVKNITVAGLQWSDYRDRDPAAVARAHRALVGLWAEGKVRPAVAGEYPLERAAEALARLERGGVGGKLLLATAGSL
jgi:NADPH:quinone reductase